MKKTFLSLIKNIAAALSLPAYASFPLQDEAYKGDIAQVRELIEKGADVNAANNDGATALMWASQEGHAGLERSGRYFGFFLLVFLKDRQPSLDDYLLLVSHRFLLWS